MSYVHARAYNNTCQSEFLYAHLDWLTNYIDNIIKQLQNYNSLEVQCTKVIYRFVVTDTAHQR